MNRSGAVSVFKYKGRKERKAEIGLERFEELLETCRRSLGVTFSIVYSQEGAEVSWLIHLKAFEKRDGLVNPGVSLGFCVSLSAATIISGTKLMEIEWKTDG